MSGTFGQLDQKLYNRQLEAWVLGKIPIAHDIGMCFSCIKACHFMRILLVMVSNYCSKGWIFVQLLESQENQGFEGGPRVELM